MIWIPTEFTGVKTPDEGQLSVIYMVIYILYTLAALSVFALGGYVFFLSFGQPTEKAELATRARWLGPCIMAAAIAMKPSWIVAFVNRFARRLARREK
ncbi:MAG: hypothetical protein QF408_05655 [Pirellulales bacterium]|jgi:hypothetical protein|nr:hypothetical protein [Pirellulales bacterium]HJN65734.1 hypothetical protein [Pirellulales bacterium]